MFFFLLEKTRKDESGLVSVFSLMVLVTLTIAGIAAVSTSNNEAKIVRNEQLANIEFYNSETGINDARLNYLNWMTDDFLSDDETVANAILDSVAVDANGDPVATLQVRCIENNNSGDVTPIFNNVADQLPAMRHISPPPSGSGYSVKYFETRRYSITSTSGSGNTVVQAGVWKVFNKY